MFATDFAIPAEIEHYLTLVTDSHIVRGTFHSRKRRITDILNQAEHDFRTGPTGSQAVGATAADCRRAPAVIRCSAPCCSPL